LPLMYDVVVFDVHLFDQAINLGINVLANLGSQLGFAFELEVGLVEAEKPEGADHGCRYCEGFRKRSTTEQAGSLAQESPHGQKEQVLVLQRIGEGGGTMRTNDLDALQESVGCAAVDHL